MRGTKLSRKNCQYRRRWQESFWFPGGELCFGIGGESAKFLGRWGRPGVGYQLTGDKIKIWRKAGFDLRQTSRSGYLCKFGDLVWRKRRGRGGSRRAPVRYISGRRGERERDWARAVVGNRLRVRG